MTDAPERIWAESRSCTVDASGASRLLSMDREFSRGTEYIRADLAAPMRCAECDCEKGGADCNWIATPTPLDDPRALALVEALRNAEAVMTNPDCQPGNSITRAIEKARAALEAIASSSLSALEENK